MWAITILVPIIIEPIFSRGKLLVSCFFQTAKLYLLSEILSSWWYSCTHLICHFVSLQLDLYNLTETVSQIIIIIII